MLPLAWRRRTFWEAWVGRSTPSKKCGPSRGTRHVCLRLFPQHPGAEVYTYRPVTGIPGVREASRALSRLCALNLLIADVAGFHPDVIYLRSGTYLMPAHKLFRIAPVVMELNSNDIGETRLRGRYFHFYNLLTRGILFRNASGLVAVTREIGEMQQNKRYRKPTLVIGNGIDLSEYEPLPAPKNSSPVITLVGSAGQPWHGADKLISLAKQCNDLKINIVGYQRTDISGTMPGNVQLHGFLEDTGVREVLRGSDVSCGSLALHRNGMQEGSSLKVREALAYGIPVLLGNRDTDLSGLQSECILELPNCPENVADHMEVIRAFAHNMMGKRIPRDAVAGRIDQGLKEQMRLQFFQQISERHWIPQNVTTLGVPR